MHVFKAMRVGKASALMVGLVVMLALVFGVGTTTLAAVPGDPFRLGQLNAINRVSQLVSSVASPVPAVDNNGTGPALDLRVEPGKAPLRVSPGAGTAIGLRAEDAKTADVAGKASDSEKIDDKDSSEFAAGVNGKATHADQADSATTAQNAQNAGTLDNKDSADFMAVTLPAVRVGLQYQHYVESNAQYTPVGFATEDFDLVGGGQGGEMHTAANNSRLVAPRAGIYQVDVQLS